MNLVLSFIHPSKPSREVGPFTSLRMDAETVRDGAGGKAIARHWEHQWEVDGERYFRVDATTRVRIHFEHDRQMERATGKSRAFGPFEKFSAVDGIAYTDDRVFAFVDARVGDWFCYGDGRHWSVMVVTDASGSAAKDILRSAVGLAPLLAGVIGLWEGAKLLYLGRAQSIRARLQALATECHAPDPGRVTAVTWECHPDPANREAELYAEYLKGSRTLLHTYGHAHGNLVRTSRLINGARAAVEIARGVRAHARYLRAARMAAAPR